jgi:hypothetical protein
MAGDVTGRAMIPYCLARRESQGRRCYGDEMLNERKGECDLAIMFAKILSGLINVSLPCRCPHLSLKMEVHCITLPVMPLWG